MDRVQLVDEQRRLIRIQAAVLKASKEPHDPATDELIEAVAQLTITVKALLKDQQE